MMNKYENDKGGEPKGLGIKKMKTVVIENVTIIRRVSVTNQNGQGQGEEAGPSHQTTWSVKELHVCKRGMVVRRS